VTNEEEKKDVPSQNVKKPWSNQEHKADQVAEETSTHIPCLFIRTNSAKLMIYFHGNAEDLGLAS